MTSTVDSVELFRTLEQALRAGFSLRQGLARAAHDFDDAQLTAVATGDEGCPVDEPVHWLG